MSYPSNNDILRYVLINEGVSWYMWSYYEMVRESDFIAWRNLLLFRKTSVGGKTKERLLFGEDTRMRLGQLSLDNIFTTGPPQEEVGRYYYSSY